ncbi:MAG: ComF family protein, partial [Burkholderiaceae bacterium]|nr:ComF family protein [Burkholderiaceae bacterium]
DTLNLIANGTTQSDPVTVKDIDLINVQVATTSGATLDEIAAVLKRAGAARVINLVVARTP